MVPLNQVQIWLLGLSNTLMCARSMAAHCPQSVVFLVSLQFTGVGVPLSLPSSLSSESSRWSRRKHLQHPFRMSSGLTTWFGNWLTRLKGMKTRSCCWESGRRMTWVEEFSCFYWSDGMPENIWWQQSCCLSAYWSCGASDISYHQRCGYRWSS